MKIIKLIITMLVLSLSFFNQAHDSKDHKLDNTVIPKVSVQLWSVKHELKKDFKGTLQQISEMGFDGVEFAGEFGPYKKDAPGLKKYLDSLGLKVSAGHVNFSALDKDNFEQSVAFYKGLDTDTIIISWDDRAWNTEKVDSLIIDLNTLYVKLKAEGFKFGFHNHDKEFDEHNNATFWDHIARSTPDDFILQLDIGWVTFAEKNPVTYIERYPGRTLTTHIKAKLPNNGNEFKGKRPIVGDDVTDWPAVLKAEISVGGTLWFVVEQEEYPDGLTPLQAVELSKQGLDKYIEGL
jgi:sugar phosphate isomerase/epimerase